MYQDMVQVYTDGSAIDNPGPGGWAFCYNCSNVDTSPVLGRANQDLHTESCIQNVIVSGGEIQTTNNRMELQAVIESLKWIKDVPIVINSDSQLTIKCAEKLWKRKANLDLWAKYDKISEQRTIIFKWVKAHAGDKYNEIVDKAARNEAYLKKESSSKV
tara:strand:+ start:163 stop:639 length:477 start_codon:yes stop_codon:yes gene_type:complete